MTAGGILTRRLELIPQSREDLREMVEEMQPEERAQLSAAWLGVLDGSIPSDPWVHGFILIHRESRTTAGRCGFTGPPGEDGTVEIAYCVAPEHRGKGYATEAAE